MSRFAEMLNISKQFGTVLANDNVTFDVKAGEIHGIVGGNGAGKSTLMKILFGMLKPDSGIIKINKREKHFNSPHDAIREKIGMVHQDFVLVDTFSALDNIILGNESTRYGFLKRNEIKNRILELIETYRLYFNPDELIKNLSIGEQQRVELVKVLLQDTELIIFDEPTASLTGSETAMLFGIMERLKNSGKSMVFISHKLPEVLEISDRISVMRKGRIITSVTSAEANMNKMTHMIAGEKLELKETLFKEKKETVFKLENVVLKRNKEDYLTISIEIKKGEITGITGIEGNGQKELEGLLSGAIKPDGGRLFFKGMYYQYLTSTWLNENNISFISSKKLEDGLLENFFIYENLILGKLNEKRFNKHGFLLNDSILRYTHTLIKDYNIEPDNLFMQVKHLSGGNQQKVILARELSKSPDLIIACNPTRGIDIKSSFFIHNKLLELKEKGAGILLISSDIDEVFKLASTIAVLYMGKISGICSTDKTSKDEIEFMMLGGER